MAEEAPALRDLDPPPPPPLGVLGELPGSCCVAGRDNGDDGPAPSPEFRPGWEVAPPPPGGLAWSLPPSSTAASKGLSVSGKALVQAVRADWRRAS